MSMSTDIPNGECTFCGGPITSIQCDLHWSEPGKSGGFGYSGVCQQCDIDYRLSFYNEAFDEWRPSAPDPSKLISIAREPELESQSRKLQRYAVLGSQWQAFLARRRKGDEVWRVQDGFAGVRGANCVRVLLAKVT